MPIPNLRACSVEQLEKLAPTNTAAFMVYYTRKWPYECQLRWSERLDNDELKWEGDWEPRDHGKSELFTINYPLRKICQDPEIRILLIKNTKRSGEKTLGVVKSHLEVNKRIKAGWHDWWMQKVGVPDISNRGGRIPGISGDTSTQSSWGSDKIYVKRLSDHQDPTMEVVGVGGAITGGHFDIIILDDVEEPSRQKTDMAYEDQIAWYQGTIVQLREPWTKIIVVGTMKKADGDLYAAIRKNPLYSVNIESAIISPSVSEISYERCYDDPKEPARVTGVKNIQTKTGEPIKVLCPEKWDIASLVIDREATGSLMWRREKLNDLSAFTEKTFQRAWFVQRYPLALLAHETTCNRCRASLEGNPDVCPQCGSMATTVPFLDFKLHAWDTAFTEKDAKNTGSAFSVGIGWGVKLEGPQMGYYVLPRAFRDQVGFPRLKRAVCGLYLAEAPFYPNMTLIENKASGISLLQELRLPYDMGDGRTVRVPITSYEVDKDKVARAEAITPVFEAMLVYLPETVQPGENPDYPEGTLWVEDWIEEHVNFPDSTYKDQVDTSSMALDVLKRKYPLVKIHMPNTMAAELEPEKLQGRVSEMRQHVGVAGRRPVPTGRVQGIPGRGRTNIRGHYAEE